MCKSKMCSLFNLATVLLICLFSGLVYAKEVNGTSPTGIKTDVRNQPCQPFDKARPDMVSLVAGEFLMGSPETENAYESPQHKVSITQSFAIGRCEVTVGEFKSFVNATNYKTDAESSGKGCLGSDIQNLQIGYKRELNWRNPSYSQEDNHPVVCVSWHDALHLLPA